ncbi:tRNA lysidine(34) synthetase TilS [Gammaproteobacteria bacterium]|nr:tRNA lysidine(34) synthetase TilS [Gammaproteobacteria bacterium]
MKASVCARVAEAAASVDMRRDGCFWVAYSGGLDSTVLMKTAFEVFGPERCTAVHINHGLSPKANEWQIHCENAAAAIGISIEVVRAELEKGNEELAGRRARYGIWKRLMGEGDVVATAHHADDVAETRLWQLFSGRSPIGIPPNRQLGKGHVVRPFLDLKRKELELFAARHELSWIEDESNFDTSYDRNWIRQKLLPLVGSRFRYAAHHLARLEWPELPVREARPLDLDGTKLDERVLREWLWAYGVMPTRGQLSEVLRQIGGPENGSVRVEIRNDYSIRAYRRRLHLVRDFERPNDTDILVGKEWGDSNGTLTWVRRETGIALGHGLSLRSRQGGERIRFGGKSRSLAEIYRSEGIAPWLRESMPLLFDRQNLVAIPGLALADSAKISSGWWPEWHCSIEVK